MKVLITGSGGMLGKAILEEIQNHELILPSREEMNLEKDAHIFHFIQKHIPDVVINCAAYTNVDGCEEDSNLAHQINGIAPGFIGLACKNVGAKLIHISSDYVFDSKNKTPISTKTQPDWYVIKSIYGQSKFVGEHNAALTTGELHLVRTAWLYGKHGKNFVKNIVEKIKTGTKELKIVNDQWGSPTNAKYLAKSITRLLDSTEYGIHHYVASGECTWFEFTQEIVRIMGFDKVAVSPISSEESFKLFPSIKAVRPKYSVLEPSIKTPNWKVGLEKFLNENYLHSAKSYPESSCSSAGQTLINLNKKA